MTVFLYRVFDKNGLLLYVGITTDPKARFHSHKLDKPWWREIQTITVEVFNSQEEAEAAEVDAIASEYPQHNKNPGRRVRPAPAPRERVPSTYQPLPEEELAHLRSLSDQDTLVRASELFRAGWSMKSILKGVQITPSAAWLSNELAFYRNESSGVPIPALPESPTQVRINARKAEEAERMRPRLSPAEADRLKELAPLVARYRKTFSPNHPAAIAVVQYTQLIRDLKNSGVRVKEMAEAAGVSPTNISRRLK